MANDTTTDWTGWRGHEVVDPAGSKIGKVEEIFLDDRTSQPEWLAVKTGLFGAKYSFVPLSGATAQGDSLQVPYPKDVVKDAPRIDADQHLSEAEEAELYRYYNREYSSTSPGDTQLAMEGKAETRPEGTGDNAMTRSEEELRVGKTSHEAGRARLRKWVETEHVTQTVPVTKERVTVEREPVTEANRDRAVEGAEISESEHEVILHEEEAVAETKVVPKERVRLAKETVTEDQTVEADVRKERIETEGVDQSGRQPR